MTDQAIPRLCAVAGRDDRKSAAVAREAGHVERMSVASDFFEARALLRNPAA